MSFYFSLFRLWEFLLGVLSFHFFYLDYINNKKKYSFVLILLILFFFVPFEIKLNILAVIFSFLFILKFRKFNSFSILPKIGNYSYSIYLYHLPIIYFCNFYIYNYSKYLFIFILTIIFSLISYKSVEKFNFTKKSFYALLIVFVSILPPTVSTAAHHLGLSKFCGCSASNSQRGTTSSAPMLSKKSV